MATTIRSNGSEPVELGIIVTDVGRDVGVPGPWTTAKGIFGGGGRIGVVKRLAVRTGRLRRSPAVHSRPIDLVVFQEPSQLLLLETSS